MAVWHVGETWGVQRLSEAQRHHDFDGLCTPPLLCPHVSGQRHLLHTTTLFPSLVFSATVPAPHHANKALLPSLRDAPEMHQPRHCAHGRTRVWAETQSQPTGKRDAYGDPLKATGCSSPARIRQAHRRGGSHSGRIVPSARRVLPAPGRISRAARQVAHAPRPVPSTSEHSSQPWHQSPEVPDKVSLRRGVQHFRLHRQMGDRTMEERSFFAGSEIRGA